MTLSIQIIATWIIADIRYISEFITALNEKLYQLCCKTSISNFLTFVLFCLIQEPGTEAEIKEFAKGYNAEFDLFSKIDVNGDNAHPLWKWMKAQPNGKGFMGK